MFDVFGCCSNKPRILGIPCTLYLAVFEQSPGRACAMANGQLDISTEEARYQLSHHSSCTPCVFWTSSHGCTETCDFCHLHEKRPCEGPGRPRRAKRESMKARIVELFLVENEEERHRLLQEEAALHPYARNYIKGGTSAPSFVEGPNGH